MNSNPSPCFDSSRETVAPHAVGLDSGVFRDSGVSHHGIARAEPVGPDAEALYCRWIASGRHAGMAYLEKYPDLRRDPRMLLEGAKSIICCAFPYYHPAPEMPGKLRIARYARGRDYHEVVRRRLETVAANIRALYGGETRVCVDTAPLRERYWAVRSGLGFIGLNNQLIIPGAGSYFFLGEILSTVSFTPAPSIEDKEDQCQKCGRCVKACPTGALKPDGSCDTRLCLSYLTIEHRGPLPPGTELHGRFYGCDACAEACPHNSTPTPEGLPEFLPDERILAITAPGMAAMTDAEFAATFKGSPLKRAKAAGLRRNAEAIIRKQS